MPLASLLLIRLCSTSHPCRYLLVNLLVAVILTEFAEGPTAETPRKDDDANSALTTDRSAEGETYRSDRSGDDSPGRDTYRSVDGTKSYASTVRDASPRWPDEYSLFLFSPENGLRKCLKRMIAHPGFDRIIILAIIVSSVCLAVDSPRNDPESELAIMLKHFDLFFTGAEIGPKHAPFTANPLPLP